MRICASKSAQRSQISGFAREFGCTLPGGNSANAREASSRIFPAARARAQVFMNAATVSLVGSLLTAGLTALSSEHAPTALAVLKWTYVICGSGLQVLGLKLLADALTGRTDLSDYEPSEA